MKIKTTERGWGGHFCLANRCKFRRNTLVEFGDKRYVVSTVGALLDRDFKKYETFGIDNRYYETFIFEAQLDKIYWDINVKKQVYLDSNWQINELEFHSDRDANNMHEENVKELCQKLVDNLL